MFLNVVEKADWRDFFKFSSHARSSCSLSLFVPWWGRIRSCTVRGPRRFFTFSAAGFFVSVCKGESRYYFKGCMATEHPQRTNERLVRPGDEHQLACRTRGKKVNES